MFLLSVAVGSANQQHMKRRMVKFFSVSAILLLSGFAMTGCDTETGPKPDPLAEVRAIIKTGSWEITYYFDGTDETGRFAGYAFVFNDDETVRAARNTEAVSGVWELQTVSNGHKLVLDFGANEPFDRLNDDWDIKEHTVSKIVLEDVSGGNGEIDYLTFEKM